MSVDRWRRLSEMYTHENKEEIQMGNLLRRAGKFELLVLKSTSIETSVAPTLAAAASSPGRVSATTLFLFSKYVADVVTSKAASYGIFVSVTTYKFCTRPI